MPSRPALSAVFVTLIVGACAAQPTLGPVRVQGAAQAKPQPVAAVETPLPNAAGSLKFGILGDFGSGARGQMELAAEMARVQQRFPYEFVVTVGDNIYGSERPQEFVRKFETPYKPLLDAGVKFFASLGNHDSREQAFYKPFNMDGKTYYSFKAPKQDVRFFALESSYMEPEQIAWIKKELEDSREDWKIAYFHHPLYSSGGRHGSDLRLREVLEPLFVKHNVSVVLTGHDHFYERIKPQQGIVYFVVGSGGKLRGGNIERTDFSAKGFDTDYAFMVAEIDGDQMFFNAISRAGRVIDSGVITRRK
jgi:hypothetical protein